jgi:hypothetical protein
MNSFANMLEERLVSRLQYTAASAASAVNELALSEAWLRDAQADQGDDAEAVRRFEVMEAWATARGISLCDLLDDADNDGPTFDEFSEAYDKLLQQLAALGKHDAFGDGDFYLVNSRIPSRSMLLEVQVASVLGDESLSRLSAFIRDSLPGWQLVVRIIDRDEDIILPL